MSHRPSSIIDVNFCSDAVQLASVASLFEIKGRHYCFILCHFAVHHRNSIRTSDADTVETKVLRNSFAASVGQTGSSLVLRPGQEQSIAAARRGQPACLISNESKRPALEDDETLSRGGRNSGDGFRLVAQLAEVGFSSTRFHSRHWSTDTPTDGRSLGIDVPEAAAELAQEPSASYAPGAVRMHTVNGFHDRAVADHSRPPTRTHSDADAHEHHLRSARALVHQVTGLGYRARLQSSPAMLVHTRCRFARGAQPKLPSSASASELRLLVAVDFDVEGEHVDTGDEADEDEGSTDCGAEDAHHDHDKTDAIVLALALLQQAQEVAVATDGGVMLTKTSLDVIVGGFMNALEMAAETLQQPLDLATPSSLSSREVEHRMQRLFVSHANVFDEKVQNFIIQNFIHETDYAKVFRSAIRRTCLVKRCLKAMYPGDKKERGSKVGSTHWDSSLTQGALASVPPRGETLEACPDVTDPAAVLRLHELLARASSWDFDLFSLSQAVPGQALMVLGNELLNKHNLVGHFRTCKARQLEFLCQIQSQYHAHPYHNAEHAADVVQSLHHFFTVGKLGDTVNPRSKCAAIVAAIIHDVGHTSFTNNFHVAANDDLAVKYVYRSPLEHMHCALAFQIMKASKANVLEGLSRIEQMEVRALITDMVLATDNSVHAVYLAKLEGLVCRSNAAGAAAWALSTNPDDERLVLQMALHAADVSNPARTLEHCRLWAERIVLEFHQQGDKEREFELPVSIGYDRNNPIPLEKMQAGFILGIVRPLFAAFCQLPGTELVHCLSQIDQNLAYWQREIARAQS